MNNRFEGRGNRQNGNGRSPNEDPNMNGQQRGGQQHRGGQPMERGGGHQSHRPEGGDSNYGYANQSRSFSSDSRDEGYDARELGYGDRDNQFSDRGSMQSNNDQRGQYSGGQYGANQYGNQAMRSGQGMNQGNRYQGANRGSYNGALDDSLWGPSHYPHPTSSGTTWSGGSYGGGSSFGIGIGSGSGNDMGVPFRGATTENQYGGHDYGRGHEARQQQPQFARGPKGYKRSDDRLKEDLSEKLHHAYDIDSSDVEIDVKNGEITLSGTVPSREMRYRLEHLADGVVGVNDIHNNVKVKRETMGGNQGSADQSRKPSGQETTGAMYGSTTGNSNTGGSTK